MSQDTTERCPHGVLIYQDCYHCGPLKTERDPDKDAARAVRVIDSLKELDELLYREHPQVVWAGISQINLAIDMLRTCTAERDLLSKELERLTNHLREERDALKSRLASVEDQLRWSLKNEEQYKNWLSNALDNCKTYRAALERIAQEPDQGEHMNPFDLRDIARRALAPSEGGET